MKARLTVLLLALAASCGSSDPKALTNEGWSALQAGRYQEASKHFDQALSALGDQTSGSDFKRAKMGSIEALAHTDAAGARSRFLEWAAASPTQVTDSDYSKVGDLLGGQDVKEGIAVLEAGMKAFPESPHLLALRNDLGDRAKASGSSEALQALKGLGYVGD
jgi:hypothetical protein